MTTEILLDVPNARTPLAGVCAAGQPSAAELQAARDRGVRTVVNLCPPGEGGFDERAVVESLGMGYVNIPIAGPADLTQVKARALAEVLNEPGRHPVLVHCASGNRVGALFALKAFHVDGRPVDEALALGRSAGLRALEPAVRRLLDQ